MVATAVGPIWVLIFFHFYEKNKQKGIDLILGAATFGW